MSALQKRCANCGRPAAAELCAPCEQDRVLEQAQMIARESAGKGLRCND